MSGQEHVTIGVGVHVDDEWLVMDVKIRHDRPRAGYSLYCKLACQISIRLVNRFEFRSSPFFGWKALFLLWGDLAFRSHLPRPTGLHDDNQLLALHNPSSRFLGNPFVDICFPHRDLRPPFLLRTHLFDSLRACLRLLWGTPSRLLSNGEVCNSNSRGSGRCILLLFSFNPNLDA